MMNDNNFEIVWHGSLEPIDHSMNSAEQPVEAVSSNPIEYAMENPVALLALAGVVAASLVFRKKVIDSPQPWLQDK
jgi:hypothetical protein